MLARNSDLAWLAASAASFALCNSFSAFRIGGGLGFSVDAPRGTFFPPMSRRIAAQVQKQKRYQLYLRKS